jgi:hypothetical protein
MSRLVPWFQYFPLGWSENGFNFLDILSDLVSIIANWKHTGLSRVNRRILPDILSWSFSFKILGSINSCNFIWGPTDQHLSRKLSLQLFTQATIVFEGNIDHCGDSRWGLMMNCMYYSYFLSIPLILNGCFDFEYPPILEKLSSLIKKQIQTLSIEIWINPALSYLTHLFMNVNSFILFHLVAFSRFLCLLCLKTPHSCYLTKILGTPHLSLSFLILRIISSSRRGEWSTRWTICFGGLALT